MKNVMSKFEKSMDNNNATPTVQLVAGAALALTMIASMTLLMSIMMGSLAPLSY